MIIYKCKCGDEFIAQDNSETTRRNKRIWKDKHGTRKGCYLKAKEINNPGHGYTRQIAKKEV